MPWAPASNRASAETHFYKRGASFDIPGEEVDGMDVEAVYAAGKKAMAGAATARARSSWR